MKKNIIIAVLVMTNILTLAFAYMQKQAAEEAHVKYVKVLMEAVDEREETKSIIHRANDEARKARIVAEKTAEDLRKELAK